MLIKLARHWWAFALRGAIAILFGAIAFLLPRVALQSLVILFAAYAIADGLLALVAAMRAASHHERWLYFLAEGLVGIAAGVFSFLWPGITILVFVMVVAAWALLTGGFMIAAAFRLKPVHGRFWFVVGGIASLAYGALLALAPAIGSLVLIWWIGAYAIFFGVAMLFAAFRLRAHR